MIKAPVRVRTVRGSRHRSCIAAVAAAVLAACGGGGGGGGSSTPPTVRITTAEAGLTIEVADDDVIHFELAAAGNGSGSDGAILTTPMAARTAYPGPRQFSNDGHGHLSTATLRLVVDPSSLCVSVARRGGTTPTPLTTLCPEALGDAATTLTLAPDGITNLYGLGEHFLAPDRPNGDLSAQTIVPGNADGNAVTSFNGGNTGNAQFPVLYALGATGQQYALFLDHPYAQTWDFTTTPWQVTTRGSAIRGYLLSGSSPLALRQRYMDLVGRPPVPPKKMLGLWVSEFGYDNWGELEDKLRTLRANNFPVDGFVLDLQWFGGVFRRPSRIGSLSWDPVNFPDPDGEIARLHDEQGIGLMLIEEPYVDASQPAYAELAAREELVRDCDGCGPVNFTDWWGQGGMVDFTSAAAGDDWHDSKRQPLIDSGIVAHWTDLGEPDTYSPDARYAGFTALDLFDDPGVHNVYNLEWAASIARGYARHAVPARPFILSRSGTAGLQRFGAAMWSGDIGSNMTSLSTQLNVQMHMSFSGIDYFGSDIGGYFHSAPDGDPNELYTQWFADSSLFDVPVRPHTENLCNCRETAPDRVGDPASNLENLRLRYRLVPYFYSLAHRANQFGEPVVTPLVVYYPDDPNLRMLSDEKLLGRDLLAASVSAYGITARDVYLPAGTWVDFHTQDWVDSTGTWLTGVAVRPDGLLRLPLYARAGAIIPQMFVDEQTMNALGRRLDGSPRDELVVRVYADEQPTRFTLYEDDGVSTAYQRGALRTTDITQQRRGSLIRVTVEPAVGSYDGAPDRRDTVVELAVRDLGAAPPAAVTLNGVALMRATTRSDFDGAQRGAWYRSDDRLLLVRSGTLAVQTRKAFEVRLSQP
jgi:alpha-glucosidase